MRVYHKRRIGSGRKSRAIKKMRRDGLLFNFTRDLIWYDD